MRDVHDQALELEKEYAEDLRKIAPAYRESARNLLHYLALRRHDIRELQQDLSLLGLTSFGGIEAHVMASLNSVLLTLYRLRHEPAPPMQELGVHPALAHRLGDLLLVEHTVQSLGPQPEGRHVRIMVTMPSEAAENPDLSAAAADGGYGHRAHQLRPRRRQRLVAYV